MQIAYANSVHRPCGCSAPLAGMRCKAAPSLLRCHPVRLAPQQRRQLQTVRASASGTDSDDPYKVLGLSRNADSEAVRRVYNRLIRENKGNEEAIARIENAHSTIMMSQLSARMKGGLQVDKDIKFADKAVYFPWRPRLHKAKREIVLYTAVAHAVMAAWGLLLTATAGSQPIVASTVIGAGANIYKLQEIFPPGPSGSSSGNSVLKNLLRGAALAMAATFLGCFVTYTFPDWLAAQLNRTMPYWFYEREQAILTLGTAVANWIMSSFYR